MAENILPYNYMVNTGAWAGTFPAVRKQNDDAQAPSFETVFSQVVTGDEVDSPAENQKPQVNNENYFSRIHKQISDKLDNLLFSKPRAMDTLPAQQDNGEAQLLREQLPNRVVNTWMGKDEGSRGAGMPAKSVPAEPEATWNGVEASPQENEAPAHDPVMEFRVRANDLQNMVAQLSLQAQEAEPEPESPVQEETEQPMILKRNDLTQSDAEPNLVQAGLREDEPMAMNAAGSQIAQKTAEDTPETPQPVSYEDDGSSPEQSSTRDKSNNNDLDAGSEKHMQRHGTETPRRAGLTKETRSGLSKQAIRAQAISSMLSHDIKKKENNRLREHSPADIREEGGESIFRTMFERAKAGHQKTNSAHKSRNHNIAGDYGLLSRQDKESQGKPGEEARLAKLGQEAANLGLLMPYKQAFASEEKLPSLPKKFYQLLETAKADAGASLFLKEEFADALKNPIIAQYLIGPKAMKAFSGQVFEKEAELENENAALKRVEDAQNAMVADDLKHEQGGQGKDEREKEEKVDKIDKTKAAVNEKINQTEDQVEVEFPGSQPVKVTEPVKYAQELLAQAGIGPVEEEAKAMIWAGVLIKAADATTFDHCCRVSDRAVKVAQKMGITDPGQLNEIKQTALIHDLGKVEITLGALNERDRNAFSAYLKTFPIDGIKDFEQLKTLAVEPMGKLGIEDLRKVQKQHKPLHTRWGDGLSQALSGVEKYSRGIRSHHEHYDGLGFPDGLKDEKIPLASRIMTVCDYYDSTVERDGSMNALGARSHVVHQAGKRFDPSVVSAFLEVLDDKPLLVSQTPALKRL